MPPTRPAHRGVFTAHPTGFRVVRHVLQLPRDTVRSSTASMHRSTRWTPAARASRRTAALVHVRTCTPSPSRASLQDSTEYYRLDASSNSPRPRCRTEEALDQASSAASAHGNDGGSQPLPRRSLGGERGAGGRAVASETRRRSGAATGEARSRGGAHGAEIQNSIRALLSFLARDAHRRSSCPPVCACQPT